MSKIRMEAFMSLPPNPNSANLGLLLKEIQKEYGDKVDIVVFSDRNMLYDEYNLTALPALVIGDLVRFIGFCPDKESVTFALNDCGLD